MIALAAQVLWAAHERLHVVDLDVLAQRFRVMAPDARGHGRDPPAGASWVMPLCFPVSRCKP
jgi:pimeloyl-ACP methyl ester carboxylesterase